MTEGSDGQEPSTARHPWLRRATVAYFLGMGVYAGIAVALAGAASAGETSSTTPDATVALESAATTTPDASATSSPAREAPADSPATAPTTVATTETTAPETPESPTPALAPGAVDGIVAPLTAESIDSVPTAAPTDPCPAGTVAAETVGVDHPACPTAPAADGPGTVASVGSVLQVAGVAAVDTAPPAVAGAPVQTAAPAPPRVPLPVTTSRIGDAQVTPVVHPARHEQLTAPTEAPSDSTPLAPLAPPPPAVPMNFPPAPAPTSAGLNGCGGQGAGEGSQKGATTPTAAVLSGPSPEIAPAVTGAACTAPAEGSPAAAANDPSTRPD